MSHRNISTTISSEEYHLLNVLLDREYMTIMEMKNRLEDKGVQVIADRRIKLILDLQEQLELAHEDMITLSKEQ